MAQVASVDYPNKRIYLDFETVSNGVDPIQVYREVRALRRLNESDRAFEPMISSQGNEPKGGGTFTPRRAVLATGVRLVPFDTSHTLTILTEVITADELSGADAFDRLPLSAGVDVDIDIGFNQTEIITVPTGSALTTEQATQLSNLAATLQSAGVFSPIALAGSPTSDATLANQTALASAIAQIQDILDLLGYTAGDAVSVDENTGTITTASGKRVTVTTSGNTTTITRNDP